MWSPSQFGALRPCTRGIGSRASFVENASEVSQVSCQDFIGWWWWEMTAILICNLLYFHIIMGWTVGRLDHIVLDSAPQCNPLRIACYSDEDAMGKLKQVAARAHPTKLGEQVLQRYAAFCCCRWLRQLTDWVSHTPTISKNMAPLLNQKTSAQTVPDSISPVIPAQPRWWKGLHVAEAAARLTPRGLRGMVYYCN